ncbi:hypothetical protein NDN08_001658 [Rhodosorus marinus]|uniref:HIT domain-containing protein n=1 Tax=Rhodosorus marinus TaxID=101924 RepID=A0AAV8URK4_9RHOD|nr:hypothetical protein NDN08_001658 [Rhodosorus marinus]
MTEKRRRKDEVRAGKDVKRVKSMVSASKKAMDNCGLCLRDKATGWHRVFSVAPESYLVVPRNPLAHGHCLIVPFDHEGSSTELAEEVFDELQKYRQSLAKMFFEKEQKEVVFFETASESRSNRHMAIHCIPLSRKDASAAPGYFKQALLTEGPEWSQHKKLLESNGRSIRSMIPKGFPYFNVEFGLAFGYAHVIEDAESFNGRLGFEVIEGLLDLSPRPPSRKPDHEVESQMANQLRSVYKDFDWVQA